MDNEDCESQVVYTLVGSIEIPNEDCESQVVYTLVGSIEIPSPKTRYSSNGQ